MDQLVDQRLVHVLVDLVEGIRLRQLDVRLVVVEVLADSANCPNFLGEGPVDVDFPLTEAKDFLPVEGEFASVVDGVDPERLGVILDNGGLARSLCLR